MGDTSLESIMKCSKEAIALAYMCKISASVYTRCPLHGEETENCPMKRCGAQTLLLKLGKKC